MRKSTVHITLALIGCIALAGCGGGDEKRHVYKSRQDCLDDWGGNEKDCEQAPQRSAHYGYYYGPRYSGSLTGGRGSRALSSMTVSRGGFGSLAGYHGSGS